MHLCGYFTRKCCFRIKAAYVRVAVLSVRTCGCTITKEHNPSLGSKIAQLLRKFVCFGVPPFQHELCEREGSSSSHKMISFYCDREPIDGPRSVRIIPRFLLSALIHIVRARDCVSRKWGETKVQLNGLQKFFSLKKGYYIWRNIRSCELEIFNCCDVKIVSNMYFHER